MLNYEDNKYPDGVKKKQKTLAPKRLQMISVQGVGKPFLLLSIMYWTPRGKGWKGGGVEGGSPVRVIPSVSTENEI